MAIQDEILQKLKEAMKSKDENALNALRSLKSAIGYKKVESDGELTDSDVIQVLRKEAKNRKDSMEQFKQGGRDDLVEREKAQLEVIEQFLPQEMDDAAIEKRVKEVIDELEISSKKEIGKVMGKLMPELKGRADGNKVKSIAMDLLE